MKRRVALAVLWVSIVAVVFAVWLWQDTRSEASRGAAIDQVVGNVTGTRADSDDPDYTPALLVGVAGVVGVVVAGSQLRKS